MLSVQGVSLFFGATPLFNDITFQVNPKERIALAGRNGAGKTTLLNIISGQRKPTSGTIAVPSEIKIGYLPQHLLTHDGNTVREEALLAFRETTLLAQRVEELTNELNKRTDYESEEYLKLAENLALQSDLLAMNSPDKQMGELERTLKGLGFEQTDLDRPTAEFSGGWRMRIELAKILLKQPDLLLLDEPTNHLDMESIIWLEQFIRRSSAAVIMVSHDKKFLDALTTRTIEISLGKAHDYKVNYSSYLQLRQERQEQQQRAFDNQQKMIKKTEDFIERFRYKSSKAIQVQSRIKALGKVDRIEIDEIDRRKIHFRFPMTQPSGAYPLVLSKLGVSYGELQVLQNIDLTIERGEKIALVGKNGTGKTTFLRAIMGELPYQGEIQEGHQVHIRYFAQHQASLLNPNKTVFETIDDIAQGEIRTHINDLLGAFMFGGESAEKPVGVLSGGERGRLAIIQLLLSPSNFLILDEPTNHLDISSKEVLKEAIAHYDGTVLLVSHDRDFLDGLVNKVIEFRNGGIITHLGGMPEYLEQVENRAADLVIETATTEATNNTEASAGRQSYEQQKEAQRNLRKTEKQLARVEEEITAIEQQKSNLEQLLTTPQATEQDFISYGQLTAKLEELMLQWEALQSELYSPN